MRVAFADSPDNLLVRDTGGDPALAAQLIDQLAADPDVLAVIGPQRSAEAETAAAQAAQTGLPLLLLSPGEAPQSRFVWHVATTRAQQVRALVDYARTQLGVERFAILHPVDPYGRSFADLFAAEVQRSGGSVVGQRGYRVGQRDFGTESAVLRDWVEKGNAQAVFIPDAATTAVTAAAAMRKVAPQIVLLGTETWNDPQALARAGASIEGAVFADSFVPDSSAPATQHFVSRFRSLAGGEPSAFEAQAYDAAMLVRQAIESGASTRGEVADRLRARRGYEGAGRLRAGPTGLEPQLWLLRVREGKAEEIEPQAKSG